MLRRIEVVWMLTERPVGEELWLVDKATGLIYQDFVAPREAQTLAPRCFLEEREGGKGERVMKRDTATLAVYISQASLLLRFA